MPRPTWNKRTVRAELNAAWFDRIAGEQLERVEAFADRVVRAVMARRSTRLSDAYEHMEAEVAIAHHATGKRKPTMDARYEWPD